MERPTSVSIVDRADVERARRVARQLAIVSGFGASGLECIAIAVSELGSNLMRYADGGRISSRVIEGNRGTGIEIESTDRGPGIPDVELALRDGYSSGQGLGGGLPGIVRLMDEFEIDSTPAGTRITVRKWLTTRS